MSNSVMPQVEVKPTEPSGASNAQRIVLLYCACGLPFAYLRDTTLVIESRHHGERHINIVPLVNVSSIVAA